MLLDLPIVRLRQIASAVAERLYQANRNNQLLLSWTTRTISSFIAAGYWIDPKTENVALRDASQMSLDPGERELLRFKAEHPAESSGEARPAANQRGSFERFMSAMNPQRWAGGS